MNTYTLRLTEINEEEITKVATGQKAFLRNDAFSQALPATVSQITPKGDPTRKTFRIYLLLPDNTPLQIGMTVEANVVFREKPSAVVVPTEACRAKRSACVPTSLRCGSISSFSNWIRF